MNASMGVKTFKVDKAFDGRSYFVCAASGHLYSLADPSGTRSIYPVFDLRWFPSNVEYQRKGTQKTTGRDPVKSYSFLAKQISRRIALFSNLAREAQRLICACDYDLEGETIGYNILLYACRNADPKTPILRARFSTLTESEVRGSFSNLSEIGTFLAQAGRARHFIDFAWGVNLSRALTEAQRKTSGEYKKITIGRVQGPTLSFVVDREIQVKTHIPLPFWSIVVTLGKENYNFDVWYEKEEIKTKKGAEVT